MNRFTVTDLSLNGLKLLKRQRIGDTRGYFERIYCSEELAPYLATSTIVQINRSLTVFHGTVRGMHFQYPPHSEIKLVTCLRGEVFDVVVDVRRKSPTFLSWYGERLSQENQKTLLIPEGFAHGFQTLTDKCEMLYFHTAPYRPESEFGLNALDPILAIDWPGPILDRSSRDNSFPMITPDFNGVPL